MTALCPDCGWEGKSTEVIDGGRCPICRTKVNYGSGPVAHMVAVDRFGSAADFNRAAVQVLTQLSVSRKATEFLTSIRRNVDRGFGLTEPQQQFLYGLVNQHAASIHRAAMTDWAVQHARGAD